MSTNQWERVRALFQSALEQPDQDRATFLANACQGNETIQREVEALIAAHAAASGFLETPAFRVASEAVAPTLKLGDRLGSFEVLGVLGRGGMGEVYRARDAKLGRDVAIKVLPRALAADPQRLARFDRESRILASINHPHIAAIHSVEQFEDLRLLVLELVEGPTLDDRLRGGPLPPDEALIVARELAGALEAAHNRGIVHRDLKPANIKLTSSSGIKLLDFGLAKEQVTGDVARSGPPVPDGTTEGMIVGTWSYMSPEQARGKPVDKRTDVWAFGCVLFEMLAGTRPFQGETPSDTVAAVLEREPDWSSLPAATAPSIQRVLHRCLEKDPSRRLHDIADARIEIEDGLSNRDEAPGRARPRARLRMLAGVLALTRRRDRPRLVAAQRQRQRSARRPHDAIHVGAPGRLGARFAADHISRRAACRIYRTTRRRRALKAVRAIAAASLPPNRCPARKGRSSRSGRPIPERLAISQAASS